jgi:ribosome biogenesis GTPase
MTSLALGWTDRHEAAFREIAAEGWVPARVVGEERGFYRLLLTPDAEPVLAEISGKLRHAAATRRDYPAVGDWVACRLQGERGVIHRILPRATCLTRKEAGESSREQILATNVDTVFIVTSANQDLNPRRLERYLTIVREGGAQPAILLNKIDLVPDWKGHLAELTRISGGAPVLAISAKGAIGLEQLEPYLAPGLTCVLLGSSGVGKSTLTNRLLGREKLKTSEVRAHDDRGVHTTTSRYLLPLPKGGMIIDTPGLRELQLTQDQEEGLQASFAEIEELALRCKFSNCGHRTEPGCAIRAALESGALPEARWEAYLKLQGQIRGEARRKGKRKP